MANELAAYYSILNLKEQAGVERALLSNIFSTNSFGDGQFRMFSDVVGKQGAWLTAARRFSSPSQASELDSALKSVDAVRALKLRRLRLIKQTREDLVSTQVTGLKLRPNVLRYYAH
jgi:hypothetical protein